MDAWKVRISGSYHTNNKDIIDFDGVEGFVPYCDQDVAELHIKSRYATMWLMGDKERFPSRVMNVREVHVEEIEPVQKHTFSFIGKGIKEMSFEELQDLATAKDLRRIPLFKNGSVAAARIRAYVAYSNTFMGSTLDPNDETFNWASLPDLKVEDGIAQRDLTRKVTNDDVLNAEMANSSLTKTVNSSLTLTDLKQLATQKGITFHPNIGYDTLYSRLYA